MWTKRERLTILARRRTAAGLGAYLAFEELGRTCAARSYKLVWDNTCSSGHSTDTFFLSLWIDYYIHAVLCLR